MASQNCSIGSSTAGSWARPSRPIGSTGTLCVALDTEPQRVFFTDDRELNVVGAREVGLQAHLFDGIEGLRARLSDVLG